MFFRHQVRDPKKPIRFGMASLAIMLVWPRFFPVTGGLGPDAIDAVRGGLLGVALGLLIWGASLGAFRRDTAK
jgi:hypothetical protein